MTPSAVDAINDLGCRIDDGQGNPPRAPASSACTLNRSGEYDFVSYDTTAQFCLPIAAQWGFPLGDTIVAARLRDTGGNAGRGARDRHPQRPAPRRLADAHGAARDHRAAASPRPPSAPAATGDRVAGHGDREQPRHATPAFSSTPTPTATASAPSVRDRRSATSALSSADNRPLTPSGTDAAGRPIYTQPPRPRPLRHRRGASRQRDGARSA